MTASGSYSYEVSDEQLRTFAALSDEAKIAWLEEWQRATWAAATPAVRSSLSSFTPSAFDRAVPPASPPSMRIRRARATLVA